MSNYVKSVDYAAKDALATGNPAKSAKGTEVDTEFNNIATAIASKQDASGKGAANGFAPLDASAKVPVLNLPSTVLYSSSPPIFTANVQVSKNAPAFVLYDTNATAGNRAYMFQIASGNLSIYLMDDALGAGVGVISITRSANVATALTLNATTVNVIGTLKVNGTTVTVP